MQSKRNGMAKSSSHIHKMDMVCFSHLPWDFVFQRPHHLMSRFAKERRVFYVEEPEVGDQPAHLQILRKDCGVTVAKPYIKASTKDEKGKQEERQQHIALIDQLFAQEGIDQFTSWYYTPMAVGYTRQLTPSFTVYDCMDELSAFNGAPKKIRDYEDELFEMADIVFTGGYSLYELKRERHSSVFPFPSSIEQEHFCKARQDLPEPEDQRKIPHPRIGFFGVIDERMDLGLINAVATSRPDWQIVLVGPVAKLEPEDLPQHPNIHYLGKKDYADLPSYLSGWDVAILPFAQNASTRFISPTKTPEYLAGGRPVVSTPIRDVVRPYGEQGLVWVADTAAQFIRAIESALHMDGSRVRWLKQVDDFLSNLSWNNTFGAMKDQMEKTVRSAKTRDEENVSLPIPVTEETVAVASIQSGGQVQSRPGTSRRRKEYFDYLIVGAGFAGSVLAERLAAGSDRKVLILDCRPHIAGNAYDHYDSAGLLVHKYGPHIFHTNSRNVFAYLSRFTDWRPYEHRVRASVDGQLLPIPINLDTVNRIYGLQLTSFELDGFFEKVAEKVDAVRTSEDVVVSKVGRHLYEKFFRNYTRKQWGLDPSELDAQVTSRVPVRNNRDDRYFSDVYQAMPLRGYTHMFENMLDHPNIKIMLNTDFREIEDIIPYHKMIYTGPVDEFFDYCYGKLPYRSLQFKFETMDKALHQPVAVVNYPNEHPYTRVTEFKHLTGQEHPKTTLVYEYPCSEGDPYYPIPRPENAEIYRKYRRLAEETEGVYFAGRLATYRYYNMDQVVAQALTLYSRMEDVNRRQVVQPDKSSPQEVDIPCTLLASDATE